MSKVMLLDSYDNFDSKKFDATGAALDDEHLPEPTDEDFARIWAWIGTGAQADEMPTDSEAGVDTEDAAPTGETKGGPGSGNFGHAGRVGEVGGSGEGTSQPVWGHGGTVLDEAAKMKAIGYYQGRGYGPINGSLRRGEIDLAHPGRGGLLPDTAASVLAIDAAMKPLSEGRTVFRSIGKTGVEALFPGASIEDVAGNNFLETSKLPIGTIITDMGFVSTSADVNDVVESREVTSVLAEISVPAGTLAVDVATGNEYDVEKEVLLARGQSFRVDSVAELPAHTYAIHLTVVASASIFVPTKAARAADSNRFTWEAGDFVITRPGAKGGPSSGNFGHSGRPGEVGGSGEGGAGWTGGRGAADHPLKEIGRQWSQTQPWLATRAQIEEGKVPGLVAKAGMTPGVLARYQTDHIDINIEKWVPGADQKFLLYHELGHAISHEVFATDSGKEAWAALAPFKVAGQGSPEYQGAGRAQQYGFSPADGQRAEEMLPNIYAEQILSGSRTGYIDTVLGSRPAPGEADRLATKIRLFEFVATTAGKIGLPVPGESSVGQKSGTATSGNYGHAGRPGMVGGSGAGGGTLPPISDRLELTTGLRPEIAARATKVMAEVLKADRAGLATNMPPNEHDPRSMGRYSPERQAQHDKIINAILEENKNVPEGRQAWIMGGLGGAGKTTLLSAGAVGTSNEANLITMPDGSTTTAAALFGIEAVPGEGRGGGSTPVLANAVNVNADDMTERMAAAGMLPDVDHLAPMELSYLAHEEASTMSHELADRVIAKGQNMIWDVTLGSRNSGSERVAQLKDQGYHVTGVFVDVSVEHSVEAALGRYQRGVDDYTAGRGFGGRYVPPSLIMEGRDGPDAYSKNRLAFDSLAKDGVFDRAIVIDNEQRQRQVVSIK